MLLFSIINNNFEVLRRINRDNQCIMSGDYIKFDEDGQMIPTIIPKLFYQIFRIFLEKIKKETTFLT